MTTLQPAVSDMLITVKSREIQRALQARSQGNAAASERHFLAAAHLELVLADDYMAIDELDLARRSQTSAASCLWQAGQVERSQALFDALIAANPGQAAEFDEILAELRQTKPATKPSRKRRSRSV